MSEIRQKLKRWWFMENNFYDWQQEALIFISKTGANGSKT